MKALLAAAILLSMGAAVNAAHAQSTDAPSPEPTTKLKVLMPKDLRAWGVKAKAALLHGLKDAPSARFRSTFVSSQNSGGALVPALCGEVNAKNSHGGYSGFQRFVVTNSGDVVMEGDAQSIEYLWEDACGWRLRAIDNCDMAALGVDPNQQLARDGGAPLRPLQPLT